jgi:hypothetical protein
VTSAGPCYGCGTPLPEQGPGRKRKWCSQSCRKKSTPGGTCADCGASTGYDGKAKRCRTCANLARRIPRRSVIDAIRSFAERYGRPPTATDFNPSLTAYRGEGYPSLGAVQRAFGSWNNAIAAAGFAPRPKAGGRRYVGDQPGAADRAVELYRSGLPARSVAAQMGCSQGFVVDKAREAGILRPKWWRGGVA